MKLKSIKPYLLLVKEKFDDKIDKPFFKGGLGSLIIKFGNTLLQFGVGVTLARTLGVEAFGIYTFVYAIVKLISIPTELGLPNLLIRFIPQYYVRKKYGRINGLLKFTNASVLTISALVISISLLIVHFEIINFSTTKEITFIWGLALLPILALGNIRGAALRGFRYFLLGLIPESLLRHTFFIVLLLSFYYVNDGSLNASQGMSYHVFAALGGYIIGAYWLIKYLPAEVKKAKPIYKYKNWSKVAIPFLLIGGVQIIMGKIDIVILGVLRSSAEVGIYEVAYKTAALVSFSLGAFNFILGPYFSKYYGSDQMKDLQKIVAFSVVANSIFAIGIAGILVVFGETLLGILFGQEFIDGYNALVILAITQFLSVLYGSVALLMNMTGFEKHVLVGMAVASLANIILNLLFIPIFGVVGAATTTLITNSLWKLYLVYITRNKLKIDPTILSAKKIIN